MSRFVSKFLVLFVTATTTLSLVASTEGCASSAKKSSKGGGAKAASAKTAGQKAGSKASGAKDKGVSKGAEYESVTCDAAMEGVAWCDSESSLVVCSGGEFYAVACGDLGGVCAEDDSHVIDCVSSDDAE